jgi:hypothetical protein
MEFLQAEGDQVIAYSLDAFIGDTPTDLNQYLEVASASQVQNWLYTWKPFIQSSIHSAKDLCLQGVCLHLTYFPMEDTALHPLNTRAHCTAWLQLKMLLIILFLASLLNLHHNLQTPLTTAVLPPSGLHKLN